MSENTKIMTVNQADIRNIVLRVEGETPLICHAWSEKAKKQMRDKQTKAKAAAKEAKNPEQDFQDSLYRTSDGGYGFPAVAFKNAVVRAATSLSDMTMVQVRQMFHIVADDGDLVRVDGTPTMREDMVRLNGKTADLRYRGEFREWAVDLFVSYNAGTVSEQQLVDMFALAGFSVGVGEWRPEKNGQFGRFRVA